MAVNSIIGMPEEIKTDLRNNTIMIGFVIFVFLSSIRLVSLLNGISFEELLGKNSLIVRLIFFSALMICGLVLALLHKRDMIATMFMFTGLFTLLPAFTSYMYGMDFDTVLMTPFAIVMVIVSFMFLLTKNEQRYICWFILFVQGMANLLVAFTEAPNAIYFEVADAITIPTLLYCTVCIASEGKLPGYEILTADKSNISNDGEIVDFKISGALLGYVMFALPMLTFAMYYMQVCDITIKHCSSLETVCGIMLVLVGLISLIAGRMKFTPFLFIMLGSVTTMTAFISEIGQVTFVFLFMIGLLSLFRKDEKQIVGYAIILYACSYLISPWSGAAITSNPMSIVFNIIPFVMMMYISFGLCTNKKLPLI